MAASLTMRTGIPNARAKLKCTQSLPRCFGFRRIRPLRTGAGKPIDATSNFQPLAVSLSFARNCFGVTRRPDGNSRSTRSDISSLTKVPPISTTRILLFISARPRGRELSAATEQSPHAGLRFGLRGCAARPAFYDFNRNEPEQQLSGRFQIEPQIFCNLLHGPGAVELRAELGLIRSQLQLLDAIEAFSRVRRDRCRIETYWLLRVLDETQCFHRPVIHIRVPTHVATPG